MGGLAFNYSGPS